MPRTTYTAETRQMVRDMVNDGWSIDDAAARHNVPRSTAWRWVSGYTSTTENRAQRRTVRAVSGGTRRVWSDRTFGIEFEFIGDMHAVARAMRARGLECQVESYNHRDSDTAWKVVPDGSVFGGGELVSPRLSGDAGREAVRLACEALQSTGARVSTATGTHVHHDARDMDLAAVKRFAMLWHDAQNVIDAMVAPSRRGYRSYTAPLDGNDMSVIQNARTMRDLGRAARMRSLNVTAYSRHQTMEIRQHQGTLNARKILAWVSFGQAMFEAAVNQTTVPLTSVQAMVQALNLEDETKAFLVSRAARLALTTAPAVPVTEVA
jgi:hypothetical protein